MSVEKVRDDLCCVSRCTREFMITIYDMELCEAHKSMWFDLVDWRIEPQPFKLKPGWTYPNPKAKNPDGTRKHYSPVDERVKQGWSIPAPLLKDQPAKQVKPEAVYPEKLRKKRVKKGDTTSSFLDDEKAK